MQIGLPNIDLESTIYICTPTKNCVLIKCEMHIVHQQRTMYLFIKIQYTSVHQQRTVYSSNVKYTSYTSRELCVCSSMVQYTSYTSRELCLLIKIQYTSYQQRTTMYVLISCRLKVQDVCTPAENYLLISYMSA